MRPAGKVASLAGSGGRRVSARPAPHDVVAASGWPRETRPPLCRMPTSSGGGATASRQPRQKTGNARPKGRLSNGGDVRPGEKGAPAVASRVQRRPYPQEKGALLTAVSAPPHPIVVGPVASAHLRDSPRACAEGGACVVQWYLGDPAGASCLWVFFSWALHRVGGSLGPRSGSTVQTRRLNPECGQITLAYLPRRIAGEPDAGSQSHRPGTGSQASRARVVGEKGK